MTNEQAWDYAIGIVQLDGMKPSDDFMALVEKEKRGELAGEDIRQALYKKYMEKEKECGVLRNKLGIKDKTVLDKAEVDFACNAIHELLVCPLEGNYDFQHFCNFHKFIFRDIYEWAGKTRTVEMEKAEPILGYMSIEYTVPDKISRAGQEILDEMNSKTWEKMSLGEQAKNLSRDMASLWKIHPFREGNTRTTILFICQFADSKNMCISRELFAKNPAYTRDALVAASAVFQEVDLRKPEYLDNIVKDSLERGHAMAFPCEQRE